MKRLELPAVLCLLLGSYPVWYWFIAWQQRPVWEAFALLGVSLVLGCLAALHRRLDVPIGRRSLLLAGLLARGVALVLAMIGFFVMTLWLPRAGALGGAFILYFVYLVAWQIQRPGNTAELLLSVFGFMMICTMYFLGALSCLLQGMRQFDASCWLMLAGTAAIFAVLRNLRMICEAAQGRRGLPAGLWGHNGLLVAAFLLPGVPFVLFGRQLVSGARLVLKTIWHYLVRLVEWVIVLTGGSDLFETEELPPAARISSDPGMAMLTMLIQLLVIGGVLFFLIRFREELWEFVKTILSGIYDGIRHLLSLREPVYREMPEAGYTDSVELLEAGTARRAPVQRRIHWQQRIRRLRRIPDPAERFRAGYALWMEAVQGQGAGLTPQDTPRVILERSGGIPDPDAMARITEEYYRVRYGGAVPDPETAAALERVLHDAARLFKR